MARGSVESADDLLAGLNPEQTEVVLHDRGPLLVGATAGSGKCVTGDTIVATSRGSVRIDQCEDEDIVSVDPTTLARKTRGSIWLDMGESPVRRIRTRLGYTVSATPEHPLLVWRAGRAEWKRVEEIGVDDLLVMCPGYSKGTGSHPVSTDEAYLIGLFVGDAERRGSRIYWSRGGDDLPPVCFALIERLYGARRLTTYTKPAPSKSVTHTLGEGTLSERMEQLDVCLQSARTKYIPDWLVGASDAIRSSFLSGYFDTDGSFTESTAEITSASEQLARSVHQMLFGMGIPSRLTPKRVAGYDHVYWKIAISGPALRVFQREVGFRHAISKRDGLAAYIESRETNANIWVYPQTSSLIRELLPEWKAAGRWGGHEQALDGVRIASFMNEKRSPSRETLLRLTEGLDSQAARALRALSDLMLEPVAEVEDRGVQRVYDLHVPETHSFVANGIVSHNTAALVRRIGYLVLKREVRPERILAVTFSRKAADEMNVRLGRILGGRSGARVGTFHSVASQFMREELPELKTWEVDERDDYRLALKDALGYRGMRWESADITVVSSFVGVCKARCALPGSSEALAYAKELYARLPVGQREPTLLCEAYVRGEQIRRERRFVTFDDMLLEMWALLSSDDLVRSRWAARWDYLLCDEQQDNSHVQAEICRMLAERHRNYMVVGDPSQAIYSWRGSDPRMMLAFERDWSATKILMDRNYRCGLAISEVANGSLRAMPAETHLGMQIRTERAALGVVEAQQFESPDEEADHVVRRIRELNADGLRWKDVFVLFRVNSQSRALEESAISERIPYQIVGGINFYERREVKDLLAYLRIAVGRGKFDDVRRCINAPFRYLGKQFVERIRDAAGVPARGGRSRSGAERDGGTTEWTSVVRSVVDGAGLQDRQRTSAVEWCALVDEMAARISAGKARAEASLKPGARDFEPQEMGASADEETNPSAPERIIEDVILATDYVRYLTRDEGSESPENNRVTNVRELVRASRRFGTVDALLDYIDETVEAARRAKAGDEDGADRVTMMSVHRSKGLESKAVFVVGVNEGLMPHSRAEDPDEERRLFYVACTRAKDLLSLTCTRVAAVGAKTREMQPSRFLAEGGVVLAGRKPAVHPGEQQRIDLGRAAS